MSPKRVSFSLEVRVFYPSLLECPHGALSTELVKGEQVSKKVTFSPEVRVYYPRLSAESINGEHELSTQSGERMQPTGCTQMETICDRDFLGLEGYGPRPYLDMDCTRSGIEDQTMTVDVSSTVEELLLVDILSQQNVKDDHPKMEGETLVDLALTAEWSPMKFVGFMLTNCGETESSLQEVLLMIDAHMVFDKMFQLGSVDLGQDSELLGYYLTTKNVFLDECQVDVGIEVPVIVRYKKWVVTGILLLLEGFENKVGQSRLFDFWHLRSRANAAYYVDGFFSMNDVASVGHKVESDFYEDCVEAVSLLVVANGTTLVLKIIDCPPWWNRYFGNLCCLVVVLLFCDIGRKLWEKHLLRISKCGAGANWPPQAEGRYAAMREVDLVEVIKMKKVLGIGLL